MHILLIGSGAQACQASLSDLPLTSRQEPLTWTHVEFPLDHAQISMSSFFLAAHKAMAARKAATELDGLVLTFNALTSSPAALFALVIALKPLQSRVYLALTNTSLDMMLDRCESEAPFDRLLLQTSFAFFHKRILVPRISPAHAVKLLLLRQRPFGQPLELSVLASNDFLRGVQARREAVCKLLAFADLNQTLVVSERFREVLKEIKSPTT